MNLNNLKSMIAVALKCSCQLSGWELKNQSLKWLFNYLDTRENLILKEKNMQGPKAKARVKLKKASKFPMAPISYSHKR